MYTIRVVNLLDREPEAKPPKDVSVSTGSRVRRRRQTTQEQVRRWNRNYYTRHRLKLLAKKRKGREPRGSSIRRQIVVRQFAFNSKPFPQRRTYG